MKKTTTIAAIVLAVLAGLGLSCDESNDSSTGLVYCIGANGNVISIYKYKASDGTAEGSFQIPGYPATSLKAFDVDSNTGAVCLGLADRLVKINNNGGIVYDKPYGFQWMLAGNRLYVDPQARLIWVFDDAGFDIFDADTGQFITNTEGLNYAAVSRSDRTIVGIDAEINQYYLKKVDRVGKSVWRKPLFDFNRRVTALAIEPLSGAIFLFNETRNTPTTTYYLQKFDRAGREVYRKQVPCGGLLDSTASGVDGSVWGLSSDAYHFSADGDLIGSVPSNNFGAVISNETTTDIYFLGSGSGPGYNPFICAVSGDSSRVLWTVQCPISAYGIRWIIMNE